MCHYIQVSKEWIFSRADQCIVMTIDDQKYSKVFRRFRVTFLPFDFDHRFALGENVLLIGAGPSGKDILYEIARSAKRVTISHHRDLSKNHFGANVTQKGDVRKFTENGVEFVDGSTDTFTSVLFCTGTVSDVTPTFEQNNGRNFVFSGYKFSFPFLSLDSGLSMEEGFHIHPLYKHLININHPTMALVGLQICAYTHMYDMQVRL